MGLGRRGQGHLQPLIKFLRGEPAISRGHPEQFDDTVPVLM